VPRQRTVFLLLSLVVAGGLAARPLRRVILPMPLDHCTSRRFDSRAWGASPPVRSQSTPRLCMVDDLLRQHALVGLTIAQAVELLGKPPETSYFRKYGLVYFLGAEGGFGWCRLAVAAAAGGQHWARHRAAPCHRLSVAVA